MGAAGFEGAAGRDTTGLGNAWGTRGGSFIQRILNAVIPVTVVERWYGELEGSIFGLTSGTAGSFGLRPAVRFVSDFADWELHAINVAYPIMATVGATGGPSEYRIATTMFSPVGGFDPTQFSPVGPFGPQLVTNANFDQGSVRGFAGVNPLNNPFGFGFLMADVVTRVGIFGSGIVDNVSDSYGREYTSSGGTRTTLSSDKKLQNHITFRRPLRVKRGRSIAIQLQAEDATLQYVPNHSLNVSILYTELPNPRGSFRTP